jgi:diadenosine tetraphosphate (Ap4A) HIT family hydrolase
LLAKGDLAFALWDAYPVSPGHVLVVPIRHVATWFEATEEEQRELLGLVDEVKVRLDSERRPDGYNIGINVGEAAGQTIMHLHLHVIPRYSGDVEDPTGGVRWVIPAKANYRRRGMAIRGGTTGQGEG